MRTGGNQQQYNSTLLNTNAKSIASLLRTTYVLKSFLAGGFCAKLGFSHHESSSLHLAGQEGEVPENEAVQ